MPVPHRPQAAPSVPLARNGAGHFRWHWQCNRDTDARPWALGSWGAGWPAESGPRCRLRNWEFDSGKPRRKGGGGGKVLSARALASSRLCVFHVPQAATRQMRGTSPLPCAPAVRAVMVATQQQLLLRTYIPAKPGQCQRAPPNPFAPAVRMATKRRGPIPSCEALPVALRGSRRILSVSLSLCRCPCLSPALPPSLSLSLSL